MYATAPLNACLMYRAAERTHLATDECSISVDNSV